MWQKVSVYPGTDIRPLLALPRSRAMPRRGSPVSVWPVQRLKVGLAFRLALAIDAFDSVRYSGGSLAGIVER